MRPRIAILVLTLVSLFLLPGAKPAWAQESLATPAQWTPVDQAVADYDPNQVSLRHMEAGLGQYKQNTLFAPTQSAAWAGGGLPTIAGQYGLMVPSNYVYRSPGISAMIVKPEYLVKTGPEKEDYKFNAVPYHDNLYVTIASSGMVYNLIPQLVDPVATPFNDDWQDTRVDGRIQPLNLGNPMDQQLHGDGSDFASPAHDPRETDGWVDAAAYFQQLRDGH